MQNEVVDKAEFVPRYYIEIEAPNGWTCNNEDSGCSLEQYNFYDSQKKLKFGIKIKEELHDCYTRYSFDE